MKPVLIVITIIAICSLTTWHFQPRLTTNEPITATTTFNSTILLIPLDSRPACTKFVVQLGKIAGIRILLPPDDILDHYKTAGNTKEISNWCLANAPQADAAIISIDMLIHGGLIASRHGNATTTDIDNALLLLKQLHHNQPQLAIYAFNILPRLWPADNAENNKYQKELLAYAKLIDQVYTFENPIDLKKLNKLTAKIPAELINNYNRVFEENFQLNKQLITLTQAGVITKLVIGQDDGETFGVPNMMKRRLLHYLDQVQVPSTKVFVTKGADEVATTLLADIYHRKTTTKLKINVQYADAHTPTLIMPFMATSVATSVTEKIALLDGIYTDNPADADFILFVYIGSNYNATQQEASSQRILDLLAMNYKVALVDLSEHFAANETILPLLLKNNVPINQLIAYCGWNTTSNAVGIAMSQASIFINARHLANSDNNIIALYENNLTFLTARFLEDYFYLKESIDLVDKALISEKTDTYNFKSRSRWANTVLKADMANKAIYLKNSTAYNQSLLLPLTNDTLSARISDMTIQVNFPWERSFEIDLDAKIKLVKLLTSS